MLRCDEMTKTIDWNMIFLFCDGSLIHSLGIEASSRIWWIGTQVSYNIGSEFTLFSIFAIAAIMGFIMSYAASNIVSA